MAYGTVNTAGGKPTDLSGYLKTELLGEAGGVAPLDEQAKIILDYLYTNAANALAKLDANGKLPTDLIPTLDAYILATAKGAANGVATLDANGKLPSAQLTAHGHAVGDITGVLPVSNGGTGVSSLSALLTALGLGSIGKIVAGSYTGAAANGSSAPNSLTFDDMTPKLLIIVGDSGGTYSSKNSFYVISPDISFVINGSSSSTSSPYFYWGKVTCTVSNKTISWYATTAAIQANLGSEYYYFAFGE